MNELVVSLADGHERHHIRQSGYVEKPARIDALLRGIRKVPGISLIPRRRFPMRHIEAVHEPAMIDFIRRCCRDIPEDRREYPYLFPIRNAGRPPADRTLAIGYFCFDTFTPLHREAYACAREAVDTALTTAARIVRGSTRAYALVRPPGHHAERSWFGGFCYFNTAAIAAQYLSEHGRIAMLDLDYHHGNGQQDIFWQRNDVLTISIHGHPEIAFPYFSGYSEETGEGEGQGFNLNLPLEEKASPEQFFAALELAINRIRQFAPDYIVVPLGFDTAVGDPTGSWQLTARHFSEIGHKLARLDRPLLFVQEGGYRVRALATHVQAFFQGVMST